MKIVSSEKVRLVRVHRRRCLWRGAGRGAVLVDVFEILEVVVPGELQDDRGDGHNGKGDGRGMQSPRDDVDGQGHEGDLPDNANDNVEHVAEEILILLKGRIFLQHFLQDRTPKAPRPHAAVEFLEHLLVSGAVKYVPRKQPMR